MVNDRLALEKEDNGTGIELPLVRPGLGLANIRQRAERSAARSRSVHETAVEHD
jgi:signal transduction histidine kinase